MAGLRGLKARVARAAEAAHRFTMPDQNHIIEDAVRAGVDVELVEHNLTLTPEERARQHDGALELALELKRLGEEMRAHAVVAS